VEVRHRQQLRLTTFEPLLGLCGVALGAAAIAAGNGNFPLPALWANSVMGSQRSVLRRILAISERDGAAVHLLLSP
jgi:hypothetical protein